MNPEFVIFSSIVNILIVLILSPFFDGFTRKVRALIQSRIGPPPLQSYYDIIKLMGKEDLKSTINPLFRLSPYLSIISIGMASLLIPITELTPPLNFWGDIFLFIYINHNFCCSLDFLISFHFYKICFFLIYNIFN